MLIGFIVYDLKKSVQFIVAYPADAGNRYKYNTDILGIINEEADAYIKDQKPIDEVAGIIQSRVKLYLDEQVR